MPILTKISLEDYQEIDFPKLMFTTEGDYTTIVLMIDNYGLGNGISSNHPSWLNKDENFYSTSKWNIDIFNDYNHSVTLKNN